MQQPTPYKLNAEGRFFLFIHHAAMRAAALTTEQSTAIATDIDVAAVAIVLAEGKPQIDEEQRNTYII